VVYDRDNFELHRSSFFKYGSSCDSQNGNAEYPVRNITDDAC